MDNFSIQTEIKGSVAVVTISGRIDSESAPMLDAELTKAARENANLVLELKGLDFMSSAGIRAVVKAAQSLAKDGGAVKLASVPESVQSIMYTVGLDQMIRTFATADEAVASF